MIWRLFSCGPDYIGYWYYLDAVVLMGAVLVGVFMQAEAKYWCLFYGVGRLFRFNLGISAILFVFMVFGILFWDGFGSCAILLGFSCVGRLAYCGCSLLGLRSRLFCLACGFP